MIKEVIKELGLPIVIGMVGPQNKSPIVVFTGQKPSWTITVI